MAQLYFIQAGDERGPIKIGFSADPKKRLGELQTGNPYRLSLLATFEFVDAERVEKELHRRFFALRLEGEWFAFDQVLVDTIAAITQLRACAANVNSVPVPSALVDRLSGPDNEPSPQLISPPPWWVVLWSEKQGYIHIEQIDETIRHSHDALLLGRCQPNDYLPIYFTPTSQDAHRIASAIEPWLKAMRIARAVL